MDDDKIICDFVSNKQGGYIIMEFSSPNKTATNVWLLGSVL